MISSVRKLTVENMAVVTSVLLANCEDFLFLTALPVIAVIVPILVTYLMKCQFHIIIVDSANAKPH